MAPDFDARMDALEQRALEEIAAMVEIAKMKANGVKSLVAWMAQTQKIAQSKKRPLTQGIE